MWIFEPHVAEHVFEEMIAEYDIAVYRDEWLDRDNGVNKSNGHITSITMLSGKIFHGKVFLDTTYEGDLMAAGGVSYHVGREANSVYGETYNGVQFDVHHHDHYFKNPVSPYLDPSDSSSGLLPKISTEDPGKNGQADHRIQAYCFRMCLTNQPENRIPIPKPENYDPGEYELMLRVFESGWNDLFGKYDRIPNGKTDTNNHGPFSTDNIGMNYDYPEATYTHRKEIVQEHKDYQMGLLYFLENDSRVPDKIRSQMSQWGLPKDEFTDNGHWSHQLYIREARRMIGEYVMTERDIMGKRQVPKPIGYGSYVLDSHNVQRYITKDGFVQNEGDFGIHPEKPYPISYNSITPRKSECTNLLVPVCLSSSHVAFGSIRMEPVYMILGQSATTAAIQSIEQNCPVQDIDYEKLHKCLRNDNVQYHPETPEYRKAVKSHGAIGGKRKVVSVKQVPEPEPVKLENSLKLKDD